MEAGSGYDAVSSAFYPKVAHLMPGSPARICDYNCDVRYYTTEPMNGGVTFKCVSCGHSVSTLDFNSANGNRRTQAAKAMNQHSAESHFPISRTPSPTNLGGRSGL